MIGAKEVSAAVELMKLAYEAVAAAGPSGMPAGHLYALMMSAFSSVDQFESMIALLVKTKLLTRTGHVLVAAKLEN